MLRFDVSRVAEVSEVLFWFGGWKDRPSRNSMVMLVLRYEFAVREQIAEQGSDCGEKSLRILSSHIREELQTLRTNRRRPLLLM